MKRDVAVFYGCGLEEAEAAERGAAAFDAHYDRLLASCLKHRDFGVWVHCNYEKTCVAMYARATELGINGVLIIGTGDDDDKRRCVYPSKARLEFLRSMIELMLVALRHAGTSPTLTASAPTPRSSSPPPHHPA